MRALLQSCESVYSSLIDWVSVYTVAIPAFHDLFKNPLDSISYLGADNYYLYAPRPWRLEDGQHQKEYETSSNYKIKLGHLPS